MVERIVIVGAGRTSDSLVQRLSLLAPLHVLDNSPTALAELTLPLAAAGTNGNGDAPEARNTPVRHTVTTRLADGTSRIVLEDIRGHRTESVALVAATGNDRMNLEVCRLGSELAFKPLVAIAIDPLAAPRYESFGARAIVRANLLGDVVERALQYEGMAIATNVGLGKGDLIEIQVMPSSPAIGQPLAKLNAEGWRVAAIYRSGKLVIPTGTTIIEAEDRVLLVGEPEILADVAENMRVGVPDFPLRHGPRVVVYLPNGRNPRVEAEAELFTLKTRATGLVRVHPGAAESHVLVDEPADAQAPSSQRQKWVADAPLQGESLDEHARCLLGHRPGVVVLRNEPRSFWQRVSGAGGRAAKLCNLLSVPILFPSGSGTYERIVYVVVSGVPDIRSADAALDLARMLGIPLSVLRVDLPRYFGPPDSRVDNLVETMERRTSLHGLSIEITRREGNPVAQALQLAAPSDLLVAARRVVRRDSFSAPDVALRIAQDAPCSTLVVTTRPAEAKRGGNDAVR
jgi:Trk K+ transport system NAD-binding subunit/nucleotide-binding universal stress UspA family protein